MQPCLGANSTYFEKACDTFSPMPNPVSPAADSKKPRITSPPLPTDDSGLFVRLPSPGKEPFSGQRPCPLDRARVPQGNFSVNQVEIPFMPFRSTLAPSHTANATGTVAPALNWTSLGSLVSTRASLQSSRWDRCSTRP